MLIKSEVQFDTTYYVYYNPIFKNLSMSFHQTEKYHYSSVVVNIKRTKLSCRDPFEKIFVLVINKTCTISNCKINTSTKVVIV